ncbi:MAG TPA: hypothetical protein VIC24_13185 [Gemmatimonadaceae bacterium]
MADAERCDALRRRALERACLDNELRDAAACPSRRSAPATARERVRDVFRPRFRPFARSRFAWRLVRADERLLAGSFTPDRRAFESPIAIACFVDRAPCFPSRM